jgi:hypothetical protein
MRFNRIMLAAALACGVVATPGIASAAPATASCVGGAFTSRPVNGTKVHRGQVVRLTLTVKVVGDTTVAGCARDVLLAGPVDFVSAAPGGAYWPNTTNGPMAEVSWNGTIQPGTVLQGTVVVKVSATAAKGATINATSGSAVTYTVR